MVGNRHELAEERSLALHAEVAARLREDPLVLEKARARVEGWLADALGSAGARAAASPIDGLLAATALEHGLTFVTRNAAHVAASGVDSINPFGF